MRSIYWKEIHHFFSSLIGYMVVGGFLVLLGLMLWVFPDSNILEGKFASLEGLFDTAPLVFLFLIPAITMRSFSEEQSSGTIELLITKPLKEWEIIVGKFLACQTLILFALLPTGLYYLTIYQLGSPPGNLDSGAIMGSYIGLFLLAACFNAVGIFASTLTKNQIVAFITATFLCFFLHWGFSFVSRIPIFLGNLDNLIETLGIDFHYGSISRGLIDSRDVIYFMSIIVFFLFMTLLRLERRKW